jgi:16S rRNA pseudouridine516 synthase
MRLDRFLADMNAGSRSDLKKLIRRGSVVCNGKTVTDPGAQVSAGDRVECCGKTIVYNIYEYYMMNKPAGVLTATEDRKQRTVLDLLGSDRRRDLFPVGRLDKDTEGLLLLTNDGQLAHRLLSPGKHVKKLYLAGLDAPVTEGMVRRFAEGIEIGDDPAHGRSIITRPAELTAPEDAKTPGNYVTVGIFEGRFHEIKKMFAATGRQVLSLKRLSMGPLTLDPALAPGESRKLTAEEIDSLYRETASGTHAETETASAKS